MIFKGIDAKPKAINPGAATIIDNAPLITSVLAKDLIPSAMFCIFFFNALPSSAGAGVAPVALAASVAPEAAAAVGPVPGLNTPAVLAASSLTIRPEAISRNLPPPAIRGSNCIPLEASAAPPKAPLSLSPRVFNGEDKPLNLSLSPLKNPSVEPGASAPLSLSPIPLNERPLTLLSNPLKNPAYVLGLNIAPNLIPKALAVIATPIKAFEKPPVNSFI